jgi:hypothetical protein
LLLGDCFDDSSPVVKGSFPSDRTIENPFCEGIFHPIIKTIHKGKSKGKTIIFLIKSFPGGEKFF